MSAAMTLGSYLHKAERALSAARLLLLSGEVEGACNRAYYAMFDAAHAALCASGDSDADASPKTHRGLIGVFGLRLVQTGRLSKELGRALNEVEQVRLLADYTDTPISPDKAAWAVERAEAFVQEIRNKFIPKIEPDARTDEDYRVKPRLPRPKC